MPKPKRNLTTTFMLYRLPYVRATVKDPIPVEVKVCSGLKEQIAALIEAFNRVEGTTVKTAAEFDSIAELRNESRLCPRNLKCIQLYLFQRQRVIYHYVYGRMDVTTFMDRARAQLLLPLHYDHAAAKKGTQSDLDQFLNSVLVKPGGITMLGRQPGLPVPSDILPYVILGNIRKDSFSQKYHPPEEDRESLRSRWPPADQQAAFYGGAVATVTLSVPMDKLGEVISDALKTGTLVQNPNWPGGEGSPEPGLRAAGKGLEPRNGAQGSGPDRPGGQGDAYTLPPPIHEFSKM